MARRGATKKKTRTRRGRPPGATSDATRERILRAAFECFGLRGYATTTNKDVAERAGITAAAIYQYFDSKLSLYIESVRAAHRDIVPLFRDAVSSASTARGALAALMRAYATGYEQDPSIAPFLCTIPVEMQRHPDIARAMSSEPSDVLGLIIDIIGRGVQDGEILVEDAPGVASMFLASTMGLSLHAALLGHDRFVDAVEASARLIEGTLIGDVSAKQPVLRARRSRK